MMDAHSSRAQHYAPHRKLTVRIEKCLSCRFQRRTVGCSKGLPRSVCPRWHQLLSADAARIHVLQKDLVLPVTLALKHRNVDAMQVFFLLLLR